MKNAYCIIAHNNFNLLSELLAFLDDSNNDIYVHLDKKIRNAKGIIKSLQSNCQRASIIFIRRINVNWGGESQVKCEIELLKAATEKYHDYYHLISGVDVPLKTQNEMNLFLKANYGKQFISIEEGINCEAWMNRFEYFHFFSEMLRWYQSIRWINWIIRMPYRIFYRVQKIFKVRRKHGVQFRKGSQWFSVTHECVLFLIQKYESKYQRLFRWTFCPDEHVFQTILFNEEHEFELSNMRDNSRNLRYIDWERGHPYIFRLNDYDELMLRPEFFARKFDAIVDSNIVNKIYSTLKRKCLM